MLRNRSHMGWAKLFEPAVFYSIMAPAIAGTVGLGGGFYETFLVDKAWPKMPAMIQPDRGGINRKLFWGPVHGLFELGLLAAIWSTWSLPTVCFWVWCAFAAHLVVRIWSFAYFIPMAIRFEAGSVGDSDTTSRAARKWIRLSRLRLPLEFLAVALLFVALGQYAAAGS